MQPPSTYSLSSGFRDASISPTSKKSKRLSAQMVGRLVGSKSYVSSSADYSAGQPRRPGRLSDQDGRYVPHARRRSSSTISDDNKLSKAAAWMWHTRGISEETVLPTKLQRHVQLETSIDETSSKHEESGEPNVTDQITTTNLQPSRFKVEAYNISPAAAQPAAPDDVSDQLHTGSPSKDASHRRQSSAPEPLSSLRNPPEGNHDHGKQPSTFLYDQFDLFSLQREVDKMRSAQPPLVSDGDMIHHARTGSSSTSSPLRQIKLLSAIQKLFSKLYTNVRNSGSGPSGFGRGPRKADVGSVQHVIHHHHHHFHHYSLPQPAPASDDYLHGVVQARRRRASAESCREAELERLIRAGVLHVDAGANEPGNDDDDDDQRLKIGDNEKFIRAAGCRSGGSVRRHSHSSFSTSAQLHPILE